VTKDSYEPTPNRLPPQSIISSKNQSPDMVDSPSKESKNSKMPGIFAEYAIIKNKKKFSHPNYSDLPSGSKHKRKTK